MPKETEATKPMLPNKAYDVLKELVTIYLPALGTLYFAVSGLWGLPYGTEVVGTLSAIAIFVGVVIKSSKKSYKNSDAAYDGVVNVTEDEAKKTFNLVLNSDPDDLNAKSELKFKVNPSN